jgi:riboflavin kinase/FMN adenylyltransferase
MIILQDNFEKGINFQTYIALGNFDGLHIGHMGLINKTIELSKENSVKSLVYTFSNHPLSIISKEEAPKLIMSNDAKVSLLSKMGIDVVNLVKFDESFMKIAPEVFVKNLVQYYKPKGIIVGFNYRFGYKNIGDIKLLEKFSRELNYELHVIDSVSYENEIVSSTKIRSLIADGKLQEANELLLVPFMLEGRIVKGKQLGRTIGFPTANLQFDDRFILPKIGVYYTAVEYAGRYYKGITSVGYNPTVEEQNLKIYVETHILDFEKNIYSENLKIYFLSRIRDELKFQSLDDLRGQLELDKSYALSQILENFA